jgi:galactitol-specific phosphotransferase system IIB component
MMVGGTDIIMITNQLKRRLEPIPPNVVDSVIHGNTAIMNQSLLQIFRESQVTVMIA